jgi:hypothetical protein
MPPLIAYYKDVFHADAPWDCNDVRIGRTRTGATRRKKEDRWPAEISTRRMSRTTMPSSGTGHTQALVPVITSPGAGSGVTVIDSTTRKVVKSIRPANAAGASPSPPRTTNSTPPTA